MDAMAANHQRGLRYQGMPLHNILTGATWCQRGPTPPRGPPPKVQPMAKASMDTVPATGAKHSAAQNSRTGAGQRPAPHKAQDKAQVRILRHTRQVQVPPTVPRTTTARNTPPGTYC